MKLAFGFSPCPNDTFAFDALVHGRTPAPFTALPALHDIEELNALAREGRSELTKLSFGALAGVRDRYTLLRSGGALGHGCGPLVVAREQATLADAASGRIAIPGQDTTAYLLLRLAVPALGEVVELRYDEILEAVAAGTVDAGLIIHESRFTYATHGLVEVADLGAWWERETGMPVPLAGICARADLDAELRGEVERRSAARWSTPSRTRRTAWSTCARTPRSCPTRSAGATSTSTSTSSPRPGRRRHGRDRRAARPCRRVSRVINERSLATVAAARLPGGLLRPLYDSYGFAAFPAPAAAVRRARRG